MTGLYIAAAYGVLILAFGWPGIAAAAIHVVVLLAVTRIRKDRDRT